MCTPKLQYQLVMIIWFIDSNKQVLYIYILSALEWFERRVLKKIWFRDILKYGNSYFLKILFLTSVY
jgi:hypothetical protein